MAAGDTPTATTEVPARNEGAGFPPFKTETFPSQIFWLAITFALLFVVLWRVASPRISGVITARRNRIADDLAEAQRHRGDAEAASAAYQTALAGARARAQALAEENRKGINDEIERAKNAADGQAQAEIARAETQIAASRSAARSHIVQAAQDAAVQIVARLTGETVSPDDAAAAVRTATGG
jgi:F-type H+-transporting ATPase subunit b